MVKLFPHRLTYPDPNVQEAKRPKKVEIPPKEFQNVQGGGMYMFTVKTNAGKQYLWLALMIFAAFFFLLFRVWPEWLRVGVWYVSYYMLVFLVSQKKDNFKSQCKCFTLDTREVFDEQEAKHFCIR